MQTDLKAEADKDEENYDKMMCWSGVDRRPRTIGKKLSLENPDGFHENPDGSHENGAKECIG